MPPARTEGMRKTATPGRAGVRWQVYSSSLRRGNAPSCASPAQAASAQDLGVGSGLWVGAIGAICTVRIPAT